MRRGKGAMQLDAHELQREDQQEERGLPVDQRLANAAANPVIDAQVEERRERPDRLALGSNVPQQAGQESGQDIHGQREPLAEEQRREGDQDAAGGPDEASADDAHQDGAFERDVGGVEVADPTAHQNAEGNRDADDQDEFDLLAQRALFAEQQHAEATGAHQHAADRRGNAEADQDGDENETANPKSARNAASLRCCSYPIGRRPRGGPVRRWRRRERHPGPCRDCLRREFPASAGCLS